MTSDAAAPVPSRQIHITDELTEDQAATVLTLLADAAAEDGQQAVSEQGRLHPTSASSVFQPVMKPSCWRISAMCDLILLCGIT
ncbi:hypothetical protein ACWEO9_18430, partial [Streptomyces albidoflavus]